MPRLAIFAATTKVGDEIDDAAVEHKPEFDVIGRREADAATGVMISRSSSLMAWSTQAPKVAARVSSFPRIARDFLPES